MSAVTPYSQALEDTDVAVIKPFNPQRVVSFKLFAQKQKVLLGSMYTFLPQEQIYLKIKERWKKMDSSLKQNYTKVVLPAMHRKSPSKKCTKQPPGLTSVSGSKKMWFKSRYDCKSKADKTAIEMPPAKRVSSKAKVADWLNDPKQTDLSDTPERKRSYGCMAYSLPYEVPTIIDHTPCKQPGILKPNSSEKPGTADTEGNTSSRRHSRVRFDGDDTLREKISLDSLEKVPSKKPLRHTKTKAREQLEFTGKSNIYNFEDQIGHCSSEMSNISIKPLDENSSGRRSCGEDIVVEEMVEEEMFTTPETEKIPKNEMLKAPRKRKSTGVKNSLIKNRISNSRRAKTGKSITCETAINFGNTNNNAVNTGVFSDKPWAATTYTRKSGRLGSTKRGFEVELLKMKNSLKHEGQKRTVEKDSQSFIRDKRGLIVGPVGPSFDEDMDFPDTLSDGSLENSKIIDEAELISGKHSKIAEPLCKSNSPKKPKKGTKVVKKESGKAPSRRRNFTLQKTNKMNKSNKATYYCDFEETFLMNGATEMAGKRNTCKRNIPKCTSSVLSPVRSRVSTLCHELPVTSPVLLGEVESDNVSCSDGESLLPATPGTIPVDNPTLKNALLRMKQITSPNMVSLEETSPKLLSPTLSGISELSSSSSLGKSLGAKHDNLLLTDITNRQSNLTIEKSLGEHETPSVSKLSRRSMRLSRYQTVDNLLCSMFQTISPQEKKKATHSGRRLVASNKHQGWSNFDNLFEEKDIFE